MDGVGAPAGADVPTASTARGAGAAGSSDPAVLKFALVSPPDADDEAVDASTGGARLDRTASLVMKLLRSHPELQKSGPADLNPDGPVPVLVAETAEQCESALDALAAADPPIIAVDVEHHSAHTCNGFVALLQASTPTVDYVFDTMRPAVRGVLSRRLDELLRAPLPLKVFHGAASDVRWLATDFGARIGASFVDTHEVATALGWRSTLSLKKLVRRLLGRVMSKEEQQSDWRRRPLTVSMLSYARGDTRLLLPMAMRLLALAAGMGTEEELAARPDSGTDGAAAAGADDDDDDDDDESGDDDDGDDDDDEESEMATPAPISRLPSADSSDPAPETLVVGLRRSAARASRSLAARPRGWRVAHGPRCSSLVRGCAVPLATDPSVTADAALGALARPPLVLAVAVAVWRWREERCESLDESLGEWAVSDDDAAAVAAEAVRAWSDALAGATAAGALGAWVTDRTGVDAAMAAGAAVDWPALAAKVTAAVSARCPDAARAVREWQAIWQSRASVTMPDVLGEASLAACGALRRIHDGATAGPGSDRPDVDPLAEAVERQLGRSVPADSPLRSVRGCFFAARDALQTEFAREGREAPGRSAASDAPAAPRPSLTKAERVASRHAAGPVKSKRRWRVVVLDAGGEFLSFSSVALASRLVSQLEGRWVVSPAEAEARTNAAAPGDDALSPGGYVEPVVRRFEPAEGRDAAEDPMVRDGFVEGRCCGCGEAQRGLAKCHVVPGPIFFAIGPAATTFNKHDRVPVCRRCSAGFRSRRSAMHSALLLHMGVPGSVDSLVRTAEAVAGAGSAAAAAAAAVTRADGAFESLRDELKRAVKTAAAPTPVPFPVVTWSADGVDPAAARAGLSPEEEDAVLRADAPAHAVGAAGLTAAAEALLRPLVAASARSVRAQRSGAAHKRVRGAEQKRAQLCQMWQGPRPAALVSEGADFYGWLSAHGPSPLYRAAAGEAVDVVAPEGLEALPAEEAEAARARGYVATVRDDEVAGRAQEGMGDPALIGEALGSVRAAWAEASLDEAWAAARGEAAGDSLDGGVLRALPRSGGAAAAGAEAGAGLPRTALGLLASSAAAIGRLMLVRAALSAVRRVGQLDGPEGAELPAGKRARQRLEAQAVADAVGAGATAEELEEAESVAVRGVLAMVAGAKGPSTQAPLVQALPFGASRRAAELLRFGPTAARGLERLSPWFREETERLAADPGAEERQGPSGLSVAAEDRVGRLLRQFREGFLAAVRPTAMPAPWSVDFRTATPRKDWGRLLKRLQARGWHADLGMPEH